MELRFGSFLESGLTTLLRRSKLIASLNLLYFGSILVGALLAQISYVAVYELPLSDNFFLSLMDNASLLALGIFFFNLVISGFLLTTFSGLVFFGLPLLVLGWRALLWGALIAQLPSPQFFVTIPTFILEGEAYVIAAVAGMLLGLSWLKPMWVNREEKLTRRLALRAAWIECANLYFWVVLLLIVGAVIEAITLVYLS